MKCFYFRIESPINKYWCHYVNDFYFITKLKKKNPSFHVESNEIPTFYYKRDEKMVELNEARNLILFYELNLWRDLRLERDCKSNKEHVSKVTTPYFWY